MAKALITSGGGAKGSFTIGALLAMRRRGIHQFDMISGTSTGSFIAALVAAGELDALQRQYLSVGPNDILTMQNLIANLVAGRPFIFDTLPLQDLIHQHISPDVFNRIMSPTAPLLCITAVSLQSGMATIFSNRELPAPPDKLYKVRKFQDRDEMMKALLASGSQGGFTPPVTIGSEQFIDGGHRDVIPARIVVDQQVDTVFVLTNNPEKQFTTQVQYTNILKVLLRVIAIFVQDVRENDLRTLTEFLASRGKRPVIIAPEQDLDEENPTGLRFNPGSMLAWMSEGGRRANISLDLHNFPPPGNPPV
jgi:predicted acylesterase/phospholipase RssA